MLKPTQNGRHKLIAGRGLTVVGGGNELSKRWKDVNKGVVYAESIIRMGAGTKYQDSLQKYLVSNFSP